MPLPVQLAEHHHHAIEVAFVIGYIVHALAQVDAIARAKNNLANSRLNIIKENWIPLVVRLFVSFIAFGMFWHNQAAMVGRVQGYFHLADDSVILALMNLPVVPVTAGGWGFAVDALLGFVPYVKTIVPPIEAVVTESTQGVANQARENG